MKADYKTKGGEQNDATGLPAGKGRSSRGKGSGGNTELGSPQGSNVPKSGEVPRTNSRVSYGAGLVQTTDRGLQKKPGAIAPAFSLY